MKKNLKWILGIFLSIIIALSGFIAAWIILAENQPDSTYPDLTISDATLENDIITANITNIGDSGATSVGLLATTQIFGLILILYINLIDLDIGESYIFSINLTESEEYFVSELFYTIHIQVDPNDEIEEILEDNNYLNVEYYYEESESVVPFDLYLSNTYSLNSTISTFGYAIQFNTTQILIEDSLSISNGTCNGYEVINSTIMDNSTISNEVKSISIALHGDQDLIMRNIWDSRIVIVMTESSSISLYNCSIQEVMIDGANNLLIYNSTIQTLSSAGILTESFSLNITSHSYIEACMISSIMSFEIENSTLGTFYLMPSIDIYSQTGSYLSFGEINHCKIANLYFSGWISVDLYQTNISRLNIMSLSRVNLVECVIKEETVQHNALSILNNTKILDKLYYGIKVYSDVVNITDGTIEGTAYENNTILINADIHDRELKTIVVNNSAKVLISRTSCNFYLYDSSVVVINESTLASKGNYHAYLQDSAKLIGINTSLTSIISTNNSTLNLNDECNILMLYANSTNDIVIENCSIDEVRWYSEPQGNHNAQIIDSTVDTFIAPPSCKVDIINCSILSLYDGVRFESGTNYLNRTGSYGPGIVSDYLNITGSVITNRMCTFLYILQNSTVFIEDLHEDFIISVFSGNIFVENCTVDSLTMWNDSITHLENCSSSESSGFSVAIPGFICYGNSHLYINNSILAGSSFILLYQNAQTTINNSVVFAIFLMDESRAFISYSVIGIIRVTASSSEGYALTIIYSSVQELLTFSWKAKANIMLFLYLI